MEKKISEIENIKVHGRTVDCMEPLTLFWTGSGFECNVSGTELWVEVEVSYSCFEPWFSYTVNGDLVGRQMLTKGRYWVPLFRGMNPEIVKNVRFFKENQPVSGTDTLLQIHSLRFDGAFYPVEDKMKIEFIGDSITSGEGLFGSKTECDWISMFFSAVRDYAYLTARKLNADYQSFSQSGWGIHHGWDNNTGSAIPKHYKNICSIIDKELAKKTGSDKEYDFNKWKADVVVINLGTNDCYSFEQPAWTNPVTGEVIESRKNQDGTYNEEDVRLIQHAQVDFLKCIRECNPNAPIVWCYGMLGTTFEKYICEAVEQYKNETKDMNVSYLRLPDTDETTVGSFGHPGKLSHENSAEVLAKYIQERLDK